MSEDKAILFLFLILLFLAVAVVVVWFASADYFMLRDVWRKLECHKDYIDENPMKEKLDGKP